MVWRTCIGLNLKPFLDHAIQSTFPEMQCYSQALNKCLMLTAFVVCCELVTSPGLGYMLAAFALRAIRTIQVSQDHLQREIFLKFLDWVCSKIIQDLSVCMTFHPDQVLIEMDAFNRKGLHLNSLIS